MSSAVKNHLNILDKAMASIKDSSIFDMISAISGANYVWVLGNGGSLAIAQHFAQDLLKMCEVKALAMNDPSVITAYTNDHSFEWAYYNPLNTLKNENDIVIIFSCSGRSRNYTEFVTEKKGKLLSVVGTTGGFLKEKSDLCIHVDSEDYQVCETAFCIICDLIVRSLVKT